MVDYTTRIERALAGVMLHVALLVEIGRLQPIHGYGLIRALNDRVEGRNWFKEGTVYPILSELEREGLIVSRWGAAADGPRRKDYELTPRGRRALALASQEWDHFSQIMDRLVQQKDR